MSTLNKKRDTMFLTPKEGEEQKKHRVLHLISKNIRVQLSTYTCTRIYFYQ